MTIERIEITDREQWLSLRQRDVTASAAGALLGVHDYTTAYGLWALKSGKLGEDPEESSAMKRGRLLEPVAIALIQEMNPDWVCTPPGAYFRDPAARVGATPDLIVTNAQGQGVIQIKTVEPGIFRKKWFDPESGEFTPPLWIVVQAIIEAHLTGSQWAAVAALVVGFGIELKMVPVPIHPGIVERVTAATAEFWRQVETDEAPAMDFTRDGEVIAQLYGRANGETIDLTGDNRIQEILIEDEGLAATLSATTKRRKELKAEIIAKLGNAEFATVPGWWLSAKTISKKAYQVNATSYRQVSAKRQEQGVGS